jgi:hypothetical protein
MYKEYSKLLILKYVFYKCNLIGSLNIIILYALWCPKLFLAEFSVDFFFNS